MELIVIFSLIVVVFSVVIHEVAHGFLAEHLGDPTARLAGRLTLNPIKHLDLFGSIILPILMSMLPGGIILAWAKPVPYNPMNLKHPEKGGAIIAAAGPLSNMALAIVFGFVMRLLYLVPTGPFSGLPELLFVIVMINITLAIFNLVPIPPLDGSKILFWLLPDSSRTFKVWLEKNGFIILLVFLMFGLFDFLIPIRNFLYTAIVGR